MRAIRVGAALVTMALLGQAALAADANAPVDVSQYPGKIKVACVGDSITFGYGIKGPNSYPEQLQRMLGEKFEVKNFGVSGTTLLNQGDRPYQKSKAYPKALAYEPDVVVIMLGTNDTKARNWKHQEDFAADYEDLISKFAALKSHPRIWISHPCLIPNGGKWGINEEDVDQEIPVIDQVAKKEGVGVVDFNKAMVTHEKLFQDNVHPTAEGAKYLAEAAYTALTGKAYEGPETVVQTPAAKKP